MRTITVVFVIVVAFISTTFANREPTGACCGECCPDLCETAGGLPHAETDCCVDNIDRRTCHDGSGNFFADQTCESIVQGGGCGVATNPPPPPKQDMDCEEDEDCTGPCERCGKHFTCIVDPAVADDCCRCPGHSDFGESCRRIPCDICLPSGTDVFVCHSKEPLCEFISDVREEFAQLP